MPIANNEEDYLTDDILDESLLDEDNEDIRPERSSALQSGWDAAKKAASSDVKYTSEFRFTESEQLVKFIDSAPFAVFRQHWLERKGKKSFVCLEDTCPLCDIGDTPRAKVAFSVVNLSAEEPVVEILLTSPTLTRQLASFDSDPKTGPLDRLYWSMSRQGVGSKTSYTVRPIKARDLAEDYGIDVIKTEEEIERFSPLTDKVISVTSRSDLAEIAREMSR